jgi:uncharacterized protein YjbJ (UPF0337 family)
LAGKNFSGNGAFCPIGRCFEDRRFPWTKIVLKVRRNKRKVKVKEVAGKVTGDEKMKTEGQVDQVKGKIQNTVGGIKDSLRESNKE